VRLVPVDQRDPPGWQITEVTDAQALRQNHRVYADDGWWDEPGGLDHRVEFGARLGFGPGRPIRHWTACHRGASVGAATSFRFDDAVLLVHCCVATGWRRHGIGTALTRVRLAAAAGQGAGRAVLFPSPDGYHRVHRREVEEAIRPARGERRARLVRGDRPAARQMKLASVQERGAPVSQAPLDAGGGER
jgi:GNAT superfamily N-acetyltransferase